MRKKILFQIAAIIAGFMLALLVIIQATITHSSTQMFTEAKEELLNRDLAAMSDDIFIRGYVPELMDYCAEHMDEVSTDVLGDPGFKEAYKRVIPGLLERYGGIKFDELNPEDFPSFSPEEQAVYAHFWYYTLTDALSMFQEFYGFSGMAVIDVGGDNSGRVFSFGTVDTGMDRETLESVIADENKRNGTLGKVAEGNEADAAFGIAYSGERGNWFMGYYPLLPMTETSRYAMCIAIDLKQFSQSFAVRLRKILAFCVAVIAAFAGLLIWFLNRKAVQPVTQIQQSVRRYTDDKDTGQIVADMERVRLGNEIGILAGDISHLAEEMERYTQENMSLAAKQERINTELNMAREIQASALPQTFPAFPDRTEFDLFASMTPAKAVGGDFYDFFLIDEDHLVLAIADVSDKGVPAALFMMSAKNLIDYRSRLGGGPSQILFDVNQQLCSNAKSEMFVTVWLGILDLRTGAMTCANAGHEYPMIRGGDGAFRQFTDRHGLPLGVMPGARYQDYVIRMRPGDAVFVYTDGVPEANNAAGELYTLARMELALNQIQGQDPQSVLEGVRADVDAFVKGANQFDDLTMLCVTYRGSEDQADL